MANEGETTPLAKKLQERAGDRQAQPTSKKFRKNFVSLSLSLSVSLPPSLVISPVFPTQLYEPRCSNAQAHRIFTNMQVDKIADMQVYRHTWPQGAIEKGFAKSCAGASAIQGQKNPV